jgi:hypothetical protein
MARTSAIDGFYSANAARRGENPYGSILNGFEVTADNALRFGVHMVPLATIRRYAPLHQQERDVDSVLTTAAVFMGAAALVLVLVFEMGWRARFLVGGLLFACIAIAAIVDLMRTMKLNLFRLEIELETGEIVTFVTADQAMLMRMMAIIHQRTGIAADMPTPQGQTRG